MKKRAFQLLLCLVTLALAISPFAYAKGKQASTAPGTYKEWGPDIDEIEILKNFKIADYDKIVVVRFDTSSTPLPDQKEKSYDTVRKVLDTFRESFLEAFKTELKAKADVETATEAPKKADKTLIIRGKVEELNPGSRAGRMLVGYGAGGSGAKVSAEFVDAKTGDVLLRYTQSRRSGGTFKFAGGSDMQVLRDAIHAQAQDAAHILDQFQ